MKHIMMKAVRGFLICMALGYMFSGETVDAISLANVEYSNNGGETVLLKEVDSLRLQYDTEGEKEGYYTTFFFSEQKETLEDGNVVSFHISAEKDVKMNLNLVIAKKKEPFKMVDGAMIFAKQDHKNTYEMVPVEYGTFEIKKGFKGTIYLPITLSSEENVRVNSIGFIVVLSEDKRTVFTMDSLAVTNGYELEDEVFRSQFKMEGENRLEIPVAGEYFYDYSIRLKGKKKTALHCKYYLETPSKGIVMEESGRLVLNNQVNPQDIVLRVEINGILQYAYRVTLVRSWLEEEQDADVANFMIPDKEEVEVIERKFPIYEQWLRCGFLIVIVSYFLFYWKKIRRKG